MASLSVSSTAKRRRRKRQSGPDVTGPPKLCSACNLSLPQPSFSKSQLFKAATKRRCLSCMASGSGPAAGHLPAGGKGVPEAPVGNVCQSSGRSTARSVCVPSGVGTPADGYLPSVGKEISEASVGGVGPPSVQSTAQSAGVRSTVIPGAPVVSETLQSGVKDHILKIINATLCERMGEVQDQLGLKEEVYGSMVTIDGRLHFRCRTCNAYTTVFKGWPFCDPCTVTTVPRSDVGSDAPRQRVHPDVSSRILDGREFKRSRCDPPVGSLSSVDRGVSLSVPLSSAGDADVGSALGDGQISVPSMEDQSIIEEVGSRSDLQFSGSTVNSPVSVLVPAASPVYHVEADSWQEALEKVHPVQDRRLIVRTLTGKTITVEAKNTDTIAEIKASIKVSSAVRTTVPSAELRLFHAGVELADNLTLSELNVPHDTTVHLQWARAASTVEASAAVPATAPVASPVTSPAASPAAASEAAFVAPPMASPVASPAAPPVSPSNSTLHDSTVSRPSSLGPGSSASMDIRKFNRWLGYNHRFLCVDCHKAEGMSTRAEQEQHREMLAAVTISSHHLRTLVHRGPRMAPDDRVREVAFATLRTRHAHRMFMVFHLELFELWVVPEDKVDLRREDKLDKPLPVWESVPQPTTAAAVTDAVGTPGDDLYLSLLSTSSRDMASSRPSGGVTRRNGDSATVPDDSVRGDSSSSSPVLGKLSSETGAAMDDLCACQQEEEAALWRLVDKAPGHSRVKRRRQQQEQYQGNCMVSAPIAKVAAIDNVPVGVRPSKAYPIGRGRVTGSDLWLDTRDWQQVRQRRPPCVVSGTDVQCHCNIMRPEGTSCLLQSSITGVRYCGAGRLFFEVRYAGTGEGALTRPPWLPYDLVSPLCREAYEVKIRDRLLPECRSKDMAAQSVGTFSTMLVNDTFHYGYRHSDVVCGGGDPAATSHQLFLAGVSAIPVRYTASQERLMAYRRCTPICKCGCPSEECYANVYSYCKYCQSLSKVGCRKVQCRVLRTKDLWGRNIGFPTRMRGCDVYALFHLTKYQVCGDGSCWVYAVLASCGMLEHHWGQGRRRHGMPSSHDRARDVIVRRAVHDWLTTWDRQTRDALGVNMRPLFPRGESPLQLLEVPRYTTAGAHVPGTGCWSSAFGFHALAAVFRCSIVVWNSHTFESPNLAGKGAPRFAVYRYSRDNTEYRHQVSEMLMSVEEIYNHSLSDVPPRGRAPLVHVEFNGSDHFHALVSDGQLIHEPSFRWDDTDRGGYVSHSTFVSELRSPGDCPDLEHPVDSCEAWLSLPHRYPPCGKRHLVPTDYTADIPLSMLRSDCVATTISSDPGAPTCNVILIMRGSNEVFFARYDLVVTAETPGDSQAQLCDVHVYRAGGAIR